MARDMFIVFFWSQSIPVPTSCNIVPQHLGFPLQKPSRIAWLWAFTRTWHHRCCQGKSETLFRLAAGKMDVSWMSAEQMFLFFFFLMVLFCWRCFQDLPRDVFPFDVTSQVPKSDCFCSLFPTSLVFFCSHWKRKKQPEAVFFVYITLKLFQKYVLKSSSKTIIFWY